MICFRAITLQDTTFVKEETCNRIKLQLAWRHTPDSHAFLMPAITGNPMLRLSGSCARPGAASPSTANCARVTIFSPWQRHQNCVRRLRRCPSKRSEEHTSELQSHLNLVCRLLLEKKKN